MAATTTNDLKRGMTLDLPEGLFQVVEFQHVKPGKGPAFVRTTLRNVRSGGVLDKTFRADERVEQAVVDKKDMQFLYRDGGDYVFMARPWCCSSTRTRSSAPTCPPPSS
jgi:elongation factor P